MSFALIRTERVVRWAPLSLLLAGLLGLFFSRTLLGALSLPGVSGSSGSAFGIDGMEDVYLFLLLPALQALIVVFPFLPVRTRVREYERAWPVSMRTLVFGRLLAAWYVLLLPILLCGAAFALRLRGDPGLPALRQAVGNLAAGATLAVLFGFAWRPRALRLGSWDTALVIAVGLGLVLLPAIVGDPRIGLLYLVPIVAATVVLYIKVPVAIAAEGRAERRAEGTEDRAARRPPVSPLRWVLLRGTLLRPFTLFALPFLSAGLGFVGRENPLSLNILPVLFLALSATQGLAVLNGLDALPLKRTKLLPYIALPSLIALVAVGAMWSVFPYRYNSFESLSRNVELGRLSEKSMELEMPYAAHLRVPPALWHIERGLSRPEVTAPWGERVEPMQHQVFWGTGVSTYNPFDVADDNTVQFLVWQLSRALNAAYGWDLSQDEIHEQWFPEIEPATLLADVRLRDLPIYRGIAEVEAPNLLGDGRPEQGKGTLRRPLSNQIGFFMLVAILIWLVGVGFALRPNVPPATRSEWSRRRLRRGVLSACVVAGLLVVTTLLFTDRALLPVLSASLHRVIDGLLGSRPIAWAALDVLLAVAGYLFLRHRIQRIEVPPLPKNNWNKKELSVFG